MPAAIAMAMTKPSVAEAGLDGIAQAGVEPGLRQVAVLEPVLNGAGGGQHQQEAEDGDGDPLDRDGDVADLEAEEDGVEVARRCRSTACPRARRPRIAASPMRMRRAGARQQDRQLAERLAAHADRVDQVAPDEGRPAGSPSSQALSIRRTRRKSTVPVAGDQHDLIDQEAGEPRDIADDHGPDADDDGQRPGDATDQARTTRVAAPAPTSSLASGLSASGSSPRSRQRRRDRAGRHEQAPRCPAHGDRRIPADA